MKDAVNNVTEEMTQEKLSEILQVRRDKLAALKEAGKDPFEIVKYDVTANSAEIFANFETMEGKEVSDVGIGGQWYNKDNIDDLKNKNIFYMG